MYRAQGKGWCVPGSVQRGRDKVGGARERKEQSSCEMTGKLSVTLEENKVEGLSMHTLDRWYWAGEQSGCYCDSLDAP